MSRLRKYLLKICVIAFSVLFTFSVMAPQYVHGLTLGANTSSEESDDSDSSGAASSQKPSSDTTGKLGNLKDDYENLQKELDKITQGLKGIKTEKTQTIAEQNSLSRLISISQEQIKILNEKIAIINEQIAQKTTEITEKQADIDENYELFKVRIRALYMTDSSSVMNIVFGAQSFSDFLERSEYIKRITEHDDALIERLRDDKASIEAAKAEIDAAKAELDEANAAEAQKKEELKGQYSKVSAEVALLKQTEADYNANKAQIEKDMKETQAAIDKIYASMKDIGEYVGGDFGWPLPGYSSISSYYGWRFNGADFHTGIDITGSGVYGATIVAANSGEVAFAQTTYTAGKGYGKYVIINHGGGRSTLYGHMSSISVSLGDRVTKGDKIGEVGSTGWSTGPHLHFEIRIDGKHTNPMAFFTKK